MNAARKGPTGSEESEGPDSCDADGEKWRLEGNREREGGRGSESERGVEGCKAVCAECKGNVAGKSALARENA